MRLQVRVVSVSPIWLTSGNVVIRDIIADVLDAATLPRVFIRSQAHKPQRDPTCGAPLAPNTPG